MSAGAPGDGGSGLDADFERFVQRCSGSLFRIALLLSGDRSRAEDLLQLALFRTARRWSKARDSPEAYARRVLVNLSRDHDRRARRRVSEDPLDRADAIAGPQDAVGAILERDCVLNAVRQLSARQRELIVLRFYLDLSVAETAQMLGCSEGTVKSYTARAINRLRTLLTDDSSTLAAHAEVPHDD